MGALVIAAGQLEDQLADHSAYESATWKICSGHFMASTPNQIMQGLAITELSEQGHH